MKIIIIGAGVSGLSTYLLLRKVLPSFDSHTILVYEAHSPREALPTGASNPFPSMLGNLSDSAAVVGNIISLAPNSVRLLKFIDPKLYEIFKARGYINEHYTFKTARGHTLAVTPTRDNRYPVEYTISCPRYGLWKWLHEVVGEDKIQYRRVVEVDLSGEKPVVKFAGGGEEDADLVVGADGARSVVKKALFGEEAEGKYAARYEGFAGVGSFLDVEIPESVTKHKSMVFTFGPAGSFGYCSAAPLKQRTLSWWSNWGSPNIPDGNVMDVEDIRRQLQERHGTWKDPVIQRIIKEITTDRIYPVWTTPYLPHWGQRGAVLLGDAAHALRAMSGQGAGQALEDSVTFCLLLSHYITKAETAGSDLTVKEGIELTAKGLYEIRSPRVAFVRDRSRRMYFTKKRINNVVVEYMWYVFIYLCTKFSMIGESSGYWYCVQE
ncbi:FAD/NAD(P)-binding domain-containing protein [Cenococcum geophilum]